MATKTWKKIAKYGAIAGISILYVCLVGMVESFSRRDVIDGFLTLGRALLVVISIGMGYVTVWKLTTDERAPVNTGLALAGSLATGLIGGLMVALLVIIAEPWSVRSMFVNVSPPLIQILTFEQESQITGLLLLMVMLTGLGLVGGLTYLLPNLLRRMTIAGLLAVLFVGMLEELLKIILSRSDTTEVAADLLFGSTGLSYWGILIIFAVFAGLNGLWATQRKKMQQALAALPEKQQRTVNWGLIGLGILLLLLLPPAVGPYISQILVLVGLYTLMGLGLNIEIGLAGLLDLGFVGFFAIGAYTVALMTSTGDLGLGEAGQSYSSFWVAIPVAVTVSACAGVFLGIPVLRMRGDYLAIVTLGFAEIIRILVISDFLRPLLGGAQGILSIPKPMIDVLNSFTIKDPGHFYYLIIIGCAIIAFIAWRLQNARVGRNWMALREDEDVAEAMGINLIASKLLAFGIGAAFAGLSGAIFAAQVGSVFPHSFGLIVSINVVSLVIIGGSGSIPGVIIGALVLVGMPELLREFAEFRLLIYGALLVVMMLVKPEGLWPSEARQRELKDTEVEPLTASQARPTGQAA